MSEYGEHMAAAMDREGERVLREGGSARFDARRVADEMKAGPRLRRMNQIIREINEMEIERIGRGPAPWLGQKPSTDGLFEHLAEWREARPSRRFLIRSRHSTGYWIEIVQDTAKYEIQAGSVAEALHKVADVIDVIAKKGNA